MEQKASKDGYLKRRQQVSILKIQKHGIHQTERAE